jgi:tRNA(fMet)-specific endonuclease VapC
MFFLDTDILTRAHGGDQGVIHRIQQAGAGNVATTVVTAIEVLRGRHEFLLKASDGDQLLQAQHLLELSERLLQKIRVIPVDSRSAAEFDRLRLSKKLKKIGRADLLIACIALAHQAILVTRNVRHFDQVPGLQTENWTQ